MLAQGAWYIKPVQFCSPCTAPLHPAFSTAQDWEKSLEDLWEQSCSFNTNIYHTPSKDVLQSWCISPLLSFSAAIRSSLPHETTGKVCISHFPWATAHGISLQFIWKQNLNKLQHTRKEKMQILAKGADVSDLTWSLLSLLTHSSELSSGLSCVNNRHSEIYQASEKARRHFCNWLALFYWEKGVFLGGTQPLLIAFISQEPSEISHYTRVARSTWAGIHG